MSKSEACYIGIGPCGGVVAMVSDDHEHLRDVADMVAQFIADGLIVERVPYQEAVRRFCGDE